MKIIDLLNKISKAKRVRDILEEILDISKEVSE